MVYTGQNQGGQVVQSGKIEGRERFTEPFPKTGSPTYQSNTIFIVDAGHDFHFIVEQQQFLFVSCFAFVNNFNGY